MDSASLKFFLEKHPARVLKNEDGSFNGQVVTCPVRLCFVALEKPKQKDNGKAVYQITGLIPAGADITPIKQAAGMCAAEKWGDKWQPLAKNGSLKMPVKSQDANATGANKSGKKYQGFEAGAFYFDAQRSTEADRPVLVDRNLQPLDVKEFYSGCWAIVKLRPFAWETATNMGVSFGIQLIQKLADDDRFASEGNATDGMSAIVEHGATSASSAATTNVGSATYW